MLRLTRTRSGKLAHKGRSCRTFGTAFQIMSPGLTSRKKLSKPDFEVEPSVLRGVLPHSPNVNNDALPPAAVVLMVMVRSVEKRSR